MNSCQIAPAIVMAGTLVLMIFITKPWEAPKDNFQRWVRSLVIGTFTAIFCISGFALLGLYQTTGNCLEGIQNLQIGSWACIGIPAFVITTIGTYVGYGQIIWMQSIRKKIGVRKK